MSTRVVELVDDWNSRSFTGGYHELQELVDSDFSGVVRAGGGELFMTGGTVLAIRRGSIDDFEDASGTIFEAPDPALPLLAVMQEHSDEVRAKYYTEDTPISEVDTTLSDGGFTGFIELSENVLSGDYYVVYHGGESMAVAFVGESGKLLTDREAFDTADDEVGIYEVRPADIEPIEVPEPTGAPPGASAGAAAGAAGADEATDSAAAEAAPEEDAAEAEPEPSRTEPEPEPSRTEPEPEPSRAEPEASPEPESPPTDADRGGQPSEREPTQSPRTDAGTTEDAGGQARQTDAGQSRGQSSQPRQREASQSPSAPEPSPSTSSSGGRSTRSRQRSGAGALETQSIPSLDPSRTVSPEPASPAADARPAGDRSPQRSRQPQAAAQPERAGQPSQSQQPTQEPQQPQTEQPPAEESQEPSEPDAEAREQIEELESELSDREAEIDRLEEDLADVEDERDDLRGQLEALEEERSELQAEIDRLEEQLQRVEEEYGVSTDAERRLTASEALGGTDIFVRYHSKGKETLQKAHDGGTRKDEVTENLRLENHTQFDAAKVSVGGTRYGEFLESRHEYQFVKWVVNDLLFEIRDTGQASALQDLYDALPKVDRAELEGVIDATYTEDGQETRTQEQFDVILRDRMGNPLMVANFNDSREGATEEMMTDLVTAAERVGKAAETFACAFLVTRSFFEPGALETASEATRSGLLSRDKRRSFVNLSRKRGYHLCLVEARNDNFHVAVPEL